MGRRQDESDGPWIYDTRLDEFEHLKELQIKADNWRKRGEWFELSVELVGYISSSAEDSDVVQ